MNKNITKQLLIEVGVRAILEKSYHTVGLQEILNRAGVPKGSFYYYFKSKEDYVVEIIRYYGQIYGERYYKVFLDEEKPIRERITAFFINIRNSYTDNSCQQGCLLIKLASELSGLSPQIREALQASTNGWIELLATYLRAGQEAGEFSLTRAAEETAAFLYAGWAGTLMRMQIIQSLEPVDLFINYLQEDILREE